MRSYAVDHHVSPSSGQLDPKSGNSNGGDQKPQNKKKKKKKKKKESELFSDSRSQPTQLQIIFYF